MSKTILTTLSLVLASFALAGEGKGKSTCCQVVERTVYENPKPKYPKDPRQHIVVKRKVQTVVCSLTEKVCMTQTRTKDKSKAPTCKC
jgi:hypothetical protein